MTPPPLNDNKPPPPPPDRTFIKPECAWCEVVFAFLIMGFVGVSIWVFFQYIR